MAHTCHATACPVAVTPTLLMCKRHWFMVPRPIRTQIWRTYRPGQCDDQHPSAAYCQAAKAAVEAVALREGHTPDTRLYDLFLARARQCQWIGGCTDTGTVQGPAPDGLWWCPTHRAQIWPDA